MRAGLKTGGCAFWLFAAGLCLMIPFRLLAQDAITSNFPRVHWQPTEAVQGAKYAGDAACASCHAQEAATQPHTPMGHALEPVAECRILQKHPHLTRRIGPFTYTIVTHARRSIYSVTRGAATFSTQIGWAFGQGQAGQTYVFKYDGAFYESRVSFFNDIQGIDLTLGYGQTHPATVLEAAGRRTSTDESRECFACHATAAVTRDGLQLASMMPGITCEGCHGPGAAHIAAVKAGRFANLHIFNPGHLSTEDLSDFCGSCHRSWQQVEMENLLGIEDVRFQPYRLAKSRCFDASDHRISCLACHNPHENVRTDVAFYDSKCLTCHQMKGLPITAERRRIAPACPVAVKDCVTCHMPKYELPGGHIKFTDHYIRIVRAGAPFPY